MTRMNWDKVRRERAFESAEKFYRSLTPTNHSPRREKPLGFRAKYDGTCSNCKQRFTAGTLVKYNISEKIVHGQGCPKRKESSLAN